MLKQINPIPLDQRDITNYPKTATAHVCIVPLNKLADPTRIQPTQAEVVPLCNQWLGEKHALYGE